MKKPDGSDEFQCVEESKVGHVFKLSEDMLTTSYTHTDATPIEVDNGYIGIAAINGGNATLASGATIVLKDGDGGTNVNGDYYGMAAGTANIRTSSLIINDGTIKADVTGNNKGSYYGMITPSGSTVSSINIKGLSSYFVQTSYTSSMINNGDILFTAKDLSSPIFFGMYGPSASNKGTISFIGNTTGGGNNIRFRGIYSDVTHGSYSAIKDNLIINEGTILSELTFDTAAKGSLYGILVRDGTVRNDGDITLTVTKEGTAITDTDMDVYGMFNYASADGTDGAYMVATNNGTITITSDADFSNIQGLARWVNNQEGGLHINNGDIFLTTTGSGTNLDGMDGNASKDINNGNITITQTGGTVSNLMGASLKQNSAGATITLSVSDSANNVLGMEGDGSTSVNNGDITINGGLNSYHTYGTTKVVQNNGKIDLSLLYQGYRYKSSDMYGVYAYGLSKFENTSTGKIYATLDNLTATEECEFYSGHGLFGIYSNGKVHNGGLVQVEKKSLWDSMNTVGVDLIKSEEFINKAGGEINVSSWGKGKAWGVSIDSQTGARVKTTENAGTITVTKENILDGVVVDKSKTFGTLYGVYTEDNFTNSGTITVINNGNSTSSVQ